MLFTKPIISVSVLVSANTKKIIGFWLKRKLRISVTISIGQNEKSLSVVPNYVYVSIIFLEAIEICEAVKKIKSKKMRTHTHVISELGLLRKLKQILA